MTFFGSGHGATSHKYSKLVQYDEQTNSWTVWAGVSDMVPDDVANIVHSWDHLAIDPVCQMAVDPECAVGRLLVDEKAYYFCSLTCAAAFAQRPERYAE